jgi:hypothetical protein
MPSSETILAGAAATANEWRTLAIAWHIFFGTLLIALLVGWRLSYRAAGYLLVAPLLSVSALAWVSGNAFNGTIFAALALLLVSRASHLSAQPVSIAPPMLLVPGALLVAFGWGYPHFLKVEHWTAFTYAAPLGVLPCPTLSLLIGFTFVFGRLHSKAWSFTVAAAGFAYGAMGVFTLGIALDYGLLAGALLLGAVAAAPATSRSVRADRTERIRRLPGDDLIPEAFAVLTHAITIQCSRRHVWPWLAQMGAGSRAGWYSYDSLDNNGQLSATSILPKLQHLATGMIFPALPGATERFTLLSFEPERFLVLGCILPDSSMPLVTWALVLDDVEANITRLIVRVRAAPLYEFRCLPRWIAKHVIPVVHFIMQRKQLLGIAERAERAAHPSLVETEGTPMAGKDAA